MVGRWRARAARARLRRAWRGAGAGHAAYRRDNIPHLSRAPGYDYYFTNFALLPLPSPIPDGLWWNALRCFNAVATAARLQQRFRCTRAGNGRGRCTLRFAPAARRPVSDMVDGGPRCRSLLVYLLSSLAERHFVPCWIG